MKKSTLLESDLSDYIAFAGDSATFKKFLQKVKENGLEGELKVDELKKIYIENKPKTKKEGLSPFGDDAYLVAPNKTKMKREDILKAIKEVLAEGETVKKVIGPRGTSVAQAVSSEEEAELKKAGATIIPMEEDDHLDPADESSMAKSQLYHIASYAIELMKMIQDGEQLDAWVQSKITKAADYIDSVKHYMEGEKALAGTDEPTTNEALSDPEITTLGLQNYLVDLNKELAYYLQKGGEADLRYAETLKKDIADARAELDKRLSKKEVKEAKKKLDPVGHEDEDVDNDGKKNTKTDKYIKNRRVKIGQAIASHKK